MKNLVEPKAPVNTLPPSCQIGWFVSPAGEAHRALCGKLTCPVCAPRKLRRYRARLGRVSWSKMLTLTMPAESAAMETSIAQQAAAWRVLQRWLKRNANLREYTWCRELTNAFGSRPNLHMHVIMNSDYVPTAISKRKHKSLLNDAVVRAGFGSIFDIQKIKGSGANWYVTKYVSKCTASLPRYARRLQTNVRDMRVGEPGWHYVSWGKWAGSGVLDVCHHGSRRYGCAQCSEECAARLDASAGVTLSLNLISSMKNCVTPDRFQAWLTRDVGSGPPERGS